MNRKIALFLLAITALGLSGCYSRDGYPPSGYYGPANNQGRHVAYGSTDVRLFDMESETGHHCTVAVTDNNSGGIAMHCWN